MASRNSNRELEGLIAKTKRIRAQIQSMWERFQNLEAAIESAKETGKRAKFLVLVGGKEQNQHGKTLHLENAARLLGRLMKEGIPAEELETLIRAAEQNRLRLQMAGQTLENLLAVVDASQDANMRTQQRRFPCTAKGKQRR